MAEVKGLRTGYTTGTCAAAAAYAAAWYVLGGQRKEYGMVQLPEGRQVKLPVALEIEKDRTWFRVTKDGGDDPDVTSGCQVYAMMEAIESQSSQNSVGEQEKIRVNRELEPCYHSDEYPFLFLTGGPGIGVVTRPGLACPVGYYAINPVPRAMIFRAVGEVCLNLGKRDNYLIKIKIPEGEELAGRTFNPRLGIKGGISVLGTSGIVNPMSEEALKDTIRLEIHMKAAAGEDSLILVPGNYGEDFLKHTLGLSVGDAVHCSNFVADTVRMAAGEGIKKILFVGHIGKLVKVAGGVENTHSRYGDRRMEILAESAKAVGDSLHFSKTMELIEKILLCNTTEEAIEYLEASGLRKQVMAHVTGRIQRQMNEWGEKKVQIEVLTFSSVYGILGMSRFCGPMIQEWRERQI